MAVQLPSDAEEVKRLPDTIAYGVTSIIKRKTGRCHVCTPYARDPRLGGKRVSVVSPTDDSYEHSMWIAFSVAVVHARYLCHKLGIAVPDADALRSVGFDLHIAPTGKTKACTSGKHNMLHLRAMVVVMIVMMLVSLC